MSFRIVVLAKQVPDTRNVGKDAMKEDGTVNRSALPAIYNPEDLNALEMALELKDKMVDAEVIILTMGPGRAADIIRESIYRGADSGYLLTDRKFAGADTLATSYSLSMAIRKIGHFDVLIAGRQAIDGDTAQVGPQTAEKLDIPQITYAEELVSVDGRTIRVKRRLERGTEVVECALPCAITVHSSASPCRPRNAKRVMKYKHAMTTSEMQEQDRDYTDLLTQRPYLNIAELSAQDVNVDDARVGLAGSPTKVKKIDNVVLAHKEAKRFGASELEINMLIKELVSSHIIG